MEAKRDPRGLEGRAIANLQSWCCVAPCVIRHPGSLALLEQAGYSDP